MNNLLSIVIATVMIVANISCTQSQNEDEQIISMLEEFYIAHNDVWSTFPPLSDEVLNLKLDSLQKKYCTAKLREEVNKYLENGYDLMTNEQGYGIESLSTLSIQKDFSGTDTYIVAYISIDSDTDAANKLIKHQVTIRVAVVKEKETYRIDKVL